MKAAVLQSNLARKNVLCSSWVLSSKLLIFCCFLIVTGCSAPSGLTKGSSVSQLSDNTSPNLNKQLTAKELEPVPFARAEEVVLNNKELSEDELKGLSSTELTRLRNTVYARHGRTFQGADLNQYFTGRTWYQAKSSYSDLNLTSEDKANLKLIMTMENSTVTQAANVSESPQDASAAMQKLITAIRSKNTKKFLELLSPTSPWRLTTTITVPPTTESFTYAQTKQELDAQDGLFMQLFGNEYTDSFASNWLKSDQMWKRTNDSTFVPPNSEVQSGKVSVGWRKEGERWVLDEIAYPSS